MRAVYICDGVRTPIGKFGGSLAAVRPDDLAAAVIRALCLRNPSVKWQHLDDVIFGCANQAGEDNRNVARMASLLAGLPIEVPGITVNRLCASGMEAVGYAFRSIASEEMEIAIAGGVESMSRAPFVLPKSESAFQRKTEIFDSTIGWRFINPKMREAYGVDSMPETAENVASEYKISREDQDAFALRSQQRAARAQAAGFFADEIIPIQVDDNTSVSVDEHPRPSVTPESLAKLRPVVHPKGTVTAGNASGINDGAAALLLASEEAVSKYNLSPYAKVLGMAAAGVEPRLMGMGPVPAIHKLLNRLNWQSSGCDVIELNEAFASQALACMRELGLSDHEDRVNPNGGAIALGHPLGMSGARLVLTVAHQLRNTGARRGLASMCVGVGQGVAIALERTKS